MSHLYICQKQTDVFFYIFPIFFVTFLTSKILSIKETYVFRLFLALNKNPSMAMILFREDKLNNIIYENKFKVRVRI